MLGRRIGLLILNIGETDWRSERAHQQGQRLLLIVNEVHSGSAEGSVRVKR